MTDGEVVIDTSLDPSGFEKGLSKLGHLASSGLKVTTAAIGAVSTALTTMTGAVIKMGSEYEAQLSRVQAISGATSTELQALDDLAKQLGADTSFSATAAAAGMENLASAGFNVNDIMSAMPGLLDLAAVSGGDVAAASEVAASTIRAFALEASSAGHVANVFARAAADTNAEVLDMGEAMKYVAPVASAMGLSLEETAAAIGIMSDAGIKGGQAGTALRGSLSRLANPTKQMKETMDALGVSFYDSQGNMLSLSDQVSVLRGAMSDLTQEQQNQALVTLYGQESLSGMLALIDAGPEKLDALTDSFINSSGAAEEMADIMLDNLPGAIEELSGSIETLGLTVYDGIKEPLKEAVNEATGLIAELQEAFNTGGFDSLVYSIGDVMASVVAKIVEYSPQIIDAATNVITSFLTGIQNAVPSLAPAAVEIGASIVNGVLTIIPTFLTVGIEMITALINGITEAAPTLLETFATAIEGLVISLSEQLPLLMQAGVNLLQAICNGIVQNFPLILDAAFQAISYLAAALVSNIPQLLAAAVSIVENIVTFIVTNLQLIAQAAISIIAQLAQALISNIPTIMGAVIEIMQGFLEYVCDNLKFIADAAVEIVTKLCTQLVSLIPELVPVVTNIIMSFFNFVVQNLPTIVQSAIQIMLTLVNGIIDQIPTLIPAVIELIGQIFEAIVSNLPTIIAGAVQIVTTLAMGLIQSIPHLIAAIPKLVVAIVEGFLNTDWLSVGANIISGIGAGIASAAQGLVNIAVSAARDAINAVKSWLGIASPSKRAKKEVGAWILPGIGEGIEESEPELNEQMEDAADNMVTSFGKRSADVDVSGLVGRMKDGVAGEVNKISSDVTVRTKSGSGQVDSTADEGFDYDRMGDAVAQGFIRADVKMECDDREFGRLVSDHTPK